LRIELAAVFVLAAAAVSVMQLLLIVVELLLGSINAHGKFSRMWNVVYRNRMLPSDWVESLHPHQYLSHGTCTYICHMIGTGVVAMVQFHHWVQLYPCQAQI
jgi:hypothetical protein